MLDTVELPLIRRLVIHALDTGYACTPALVKEAAQVLRVLDREEGELKERAKKATVVEKTASERTPADRAFSEYLERIKRAAPVRAFSEQYDIVDGVAWPKHRPIPMLDDDALYATSGYLQATG